MKAPQDSVDGFDSHMVHPPGFGFASCLFPGGLPQCVTMEGREQTYHSYPISLLSPSIHINTEQADEFGYAENRCLLSITVNSLDSEFISLITPNKRELANKPHCFRYVGMNQPCSDVMGANPMINITTTEACRQKGQELFLLSIYPFPAPIIIQRKHYESFTN